MVEQKPVPINNSPKILTLETGAGTLHHKCKKVEEITPGILDIVKMMEQFLIDHQGDDPRPIGLAAPQLGYSLRIFTCIWPSIDYIITLINPETLSEKLPLRVYESCLSLPGRLYELDRFKIVKVRGTMSDGSTRTFKGRDLSAQEFSHEMNHLDGITIDMIAKRRVR